MSLTATPGHETAATARRSHLGTQSNSTLRHASDECLVALTRGGSERAFAEIMRRYQRPLQFYCVHLVGAPRAEDAVQQAFMQAFVSLRDGERREIALRPWLYRIARNCAIDLLRKQPFDHDQLDPDFDGMPQPPGAFEQKEELARIVAAIQALPERQRRALTLRELEGRSYGEISAELGHTDSGVRQLIFRARTALRNLGAMICPFESIRWRVLSSPPAAVADPHGVAVAATVSSSGGGNVLQAAASMVAATVTLMGAAAPDTRDRAHGYAPAPKIESAVGSLRALPAGLASEPTQSPAHARGATGGIRVRDLSRLAGGELVVPVAAPAAAPALLATAPAVPVADPPVPAPGEPALIESPSPIVAVVPPADLPKPAAGTGPGGASIGRLSATGGEVGTVPGAAGQVSPPKPIVGSPVKQVVPPIKAVKPVPAKPAPPKAVQAKPAPPKAVQTKPAAAKPAPAKKAAPKQPVVTQKTIVSVPAA
jgi:RNA polymerase sigma factor (sigma-70 family)